MLLPPKRIALLLFLCHELPVGFRLLLCLLPQPLQPLLQRHCLRRVLHRVYLPVDGRDGSLFAFEISVGLQIVEYGRHEPRPVRATAQLTAVGSQESQLPLRGEADKDAEHLPQGNLLLQRTAVQPGTHPSRRLHAQRMRLITERIIELLRQLNIRMKGM